MNLDPFPQDPRQYLKAELELRQERRPQYSLRAFARDLDVSPSTLSEFLKGKLGLSKSRAHQISGKIHLSDDQETHFIDLLEARFGRKPETRKRAKFRVSERLKKQSSHLSLDSYQVISDWYHLPILELLTLNSKFQSPSEIAKVLKITVPTVKKAFQRLINVGLLEFSEGQYRPSTQTTFTGDEVPSAAIRRSHIQVLQEAQKAVEEGSFENRGSLYAFYPVRAEDLEAAKAELRSAVLKIVEKYQSKENPDTLLCTTYHLFTLYSEYSEKTHA